MAPKKEIKSSKLLVVEGKEDEYFFDAIMRHLRITDIQILPIGGKTLLKGNLKALVRESDFSMVRSLGIVRDADSNPKGAFESVKKALGEAELPIPERPLKTINGDLKVTVMIMPGGNRKGMLEDLCLSSVSDDPATACIEKYFNCLEGKKLQMPSNMSKAKVNAFLSSRKDPDKRLGEAAQAGYWPWENIAFKEVKQFLRQI